MTLTKGNQHYTILSYYCDVVTAIKDLQYYSYFEDISMQISNELIQRVLLPLHTPLIAHSVRTLLF